MSRDDRTGCVIRNPILGGFYPDPSICRVKNDFYLVNSTFAYFPGIPIFHSKDLCRWEQIGNAIHRPGQLCFDGHRVSEGLFAPTIRYHKGTFYILCTLIRTGGNFIITAKDPAGPWSDPVWLTGAEGASATGGAEGIDPSIFFDDDGKVWYIGTHPAPEGEAYPGNYEIYIHEMDLAAVDAAARANAGNAGAGKTAGKSPLLGESIGIWRGALKNTIWPEGPHIYKINGWYYLLHAEGGTSRDHAVCIARAKNIRGPWEGKRGNPIVTHRHLGKNAEIVNVGHADMVDDVNGNWWMVLLASRTFYEVCPLGRETFMVPIAWEDEWPRIATKTGLIENEIVMPAAGAFGGGASGASIDQSFFGALKRLPAVVKAAFGGSGAKGASAGITGWAHESACDHFNGKLPLHWLTLRMPSNPLADENDAAFSLVSNFGGTAPDGVDLGVLRLFTRAATMRGTDHPAFAGRRLRHKNWTFMAAVEFTPRMANESAGIIIFQNEDWHYRFEIGLSVRGKVLLRLIRAAGKEKADEVVASGECTAVAAPPVPAAAPLVLAAQCSEMEITFFYGNDQYSLIPFAAPPQDARILSTEYAGGFVGTLAGVFASGNGKDTGNHADILWAEYKSIGE